MKLFSKRSRSTRTPRTLTLPACAIGAACLLILAGAPARAQELPKAEVILEKYVEVTGGRAVYEKINNELAKGTVEVVGLGVKGTIVVRGAAPDKMHTLIDLTGLGSVEEGSNGEVAWERSAATGPRIKTGEELTFSLRESTFNAPIRWRDLYAKAETTATETVGDRPCYKVVLTPAEGKPITHYYDQETGLLRKIEMIVAGPMGDVPSEVTLSDYKEVGPLRMPHAMTNKVLTQEIRIRIESLQHNVEMPANAFDPPDDVRALVEKQKAGKKP